MIKAPACFLIGTILSIQITIALGNSQDRPAMILKLMSVKEQRFTIGMIYSRSTDIGDYSNDWF